MLRSRLTQASYIGGPSLSRTWPNASKIVESSIDVSSMRNFFGFRALSIERDVFGMTCPFCEGTHPCGPAHTGGECTGAGWAKCLRVRPSCGQCSADRGERQVPTDHGVAEVSVGAFCVRAICRHTARSLRCELRVKTSVDAYARWV